MHVSTNLDVDLVAVEAADHLNLLLELQAPQLPEQATRAAQALVVVLDRSGSMSGEPLGAARRALTTLIGRLDPRDRFGLVVFDDHADVVVPTASLESLGIEQVKAAIAGIHSGGCTDLSAGCLLGLSEANRAMGDGGATVMLISDGHANEGETSPVVLGDLAESLARARITTTTIGFGLGYDEELLVALARGGNGDHVFAEDAKQVSGLLAKAILPRAAEPRSTPHWSAMPTRWMRTSAISSETRVCRGSSRIRSRRILDVARRPPSAQTRPRTLGTASLS